MGKLIDSLGGASLNSMEGLCKSKNVFSSSISSTKKVDMVYYFLNVARIFCISLPPRLEHLPSLEWRLLHRVANVCHQRIP
jgi:hypothetical protein